MPEGFKEADGALNEYFPEGETEENVDEADKPQEPAVEPKGELLANLIAEVQQKIGEDKAENENTNKKDKPLAHEMLSQLDPAFDEKTKKNPLWFWDDEETEVQEEGEEDEDEDEEEVDEAE